MNSNNLNLSPALNLSNTGSTNLGFNTKIKNIGNQYSGLSVFMKILVMIVFILVISFLAYTIYSLAVDFLQSNNSEPFLVKGTKLGKNTMIIPGSKVPPSIDGKYGVEFSYSMWIFINDWTYKQDEWKHILHKGSHTGMPLQSPGIWLYPRENRMAINMNTFYSVKESCDIGNIPINKWFHLTVVVIGKYIDVYINGRLKKRCQFKGVPKQNYGDVYINQFQGFDGFLSNVRYFSNALPFYRIEQLVKDGPASGSCIDDAQTLPPYLAPDWWEKSGFNKMSL